MLRQLASPRCTSHTDIFKRSAETGQRMSFEMSHGEESISLGIAPSNLSRFGMLLINQSFQVHGIYMS